VSKKLCKIDTLLLHTINGKYHNYVLSIRAFPVTLDDLVGHSPIAGLIKCNSTNNCATFRMVSTDVVWSLGSSWASCNKRKSASQSVSQSKVAVTYDFWESNRRLWTRRFTRLYKHFCFIFVYFLRKKWPNGGQRSPSNMPHELGSRKLAHGVFQSSRMCWVSNNRQCVFTS